MGRQGPQETPRDLKKPDPWPRTVQVTREQAEALARILERDTTARISHGGLKGLLGISDADVRALAELVQALR